MIIWIASYPRSGNTFFRTILNSVWGYSTYSIYNDIYDIEPNRTLKKATGHELIKEGDIESFRKSDKLYFIKTHGNRESICTGDKFIYLIRDGRGATLSYSHYLKSYSSTSFSFSQVAAGFAPFGSWHEHVRHWTFPDTVPNMLIEFEELVSNPHRIVDQIETFLNISKVSNFNILTIEHLKKIDSKFFRSGKVDAWKTEINDAENLFFWSVAYSEMMKHSYLENIPAQFKESTCQWGEVIELLNTHKISPLWHEIKSLKAIDSKLNQKMSSTSNTIQTLLNQTKTLQRQYETLVNAQRKKNEAKPDSTEPILTILNSDAKASQTTGGCKSTPADKFPIKRLGRWRIRKPYDSKYRCGTKRHCTKSCKI